MVVVGRGVTDTGLMLVVATSVAEGDVGGLDAAGKVVVVDCGVVARTDGAGAVLEPDWAVVVHAGRASAHTTIAARNVSITCRLAASGCASPWAKPWRPPAHG